MWSFSKAVVWLKFKKNIRVYRNHIKKYGRLAKSQIFIPVMLFWVKEMWLKKGYYGNKGLVFAWNHVRGVSKVNFLGVFGTSFEGRKKI